jgi:hypothetical protein
MDSPTPAGEVVKHNDVRERTGASWYSRFPNYRAFWFRDQPPEWALQRLRETTMPNLRLPAERWTLGRDSRARAMEYTPDSGRGCSLLTVFKHISLRE